MKTFFYIVPKLKTSYDIVDKPKTTSYHKFSKIAYMKAV